MYFDVKVQKRVFGTEYLILQILVLHFQSFSIDDPFPRLLSSPNLKSAHFQKSAASFRSLSRAMYRKYDENKKIVEKLKYLWIKYQNGWAHSIW